ncbi:MAG: relaxase [Coriobacteriaceae bacterium]|uniref:relaxase/mobilization nuclease domain-containing protein n=1 Tax=Parafannyhessea umbonata TaxID=604330 RepID=UPI000FF047FA|nr:relaxase/mobilization nuclease domain-containing protein [Atopobiaceae bacterium]RRF95304.1 MAG: relaxase [Coriobacteriaceae bacterium]
MTYLKAISGHTGTGGIRRYLERGGRALAVDLLNLGDPALCEDWAAEMDRTRRLAGNDRAWGSRRARTFKHYVVSPSPEDGVGLDTLRELATEWARRSFPDHEVAIVYHDDNEHHVPHAHVVVNNTNLETGRRLQDPDPGALNGSLQEVSRELGLSHFRGRAGGGPRTDDHTQRRAEGRQERAISGRGAYSWVADIRSRVAVARDTSTSEREFLRALEGLGVVARPASARTGGGWIYQLAGMTSRQVSGARLGTAYTREGVLARMASAALPHQVAFDAVAAARGAVEVRDLSELARVASAVEAVRSRGLRSLHGVDAAIARAEAEGRAKDARLLSDARECCEEHGLLPETAHHTSGNARPSKRHANKRRSSAAGGTRHAEGAGQRQMEVRRDDRGERGDSR